MDLWIILSLMAGGLQAFRLAGQRILFTNRPEARVLASDWAGPFARVVFGVVFSGIALFLSTQAGQEDIGAVFRGEHLASFGFWVVAVAWLQMLATVFQTRLIVRRNFALGIMYVKILIPLTAVLGVVFFNDEFVFWEWIALGIGTTGLLLMSYGKVRTKGGLQWDWSTGVLGLGAGFILALTGLAAREAGAVLPQDQLDGITRGIAALFCMQVVQLFSSIIFISLRDAREFLDLLDRWRAVLYTSIFGTAGSLCWFVAFTLAHPALVNLIGQSEFFFALAISVLYFRDWPTLLELGGMIIMAVSIVLVLVI